MHRLRWAIFSLLAMLAYTRAGFSQDVELASALGGVPLPPGYYARIAQQRDFFEVARGWIQAAARAAAANRSVSGTLPLAVVPALFADSPDPPAAASAGVLQQVLFDGPAPHGTLSEYYAEVSGSRLAVTGTVAEWVRTSLTRQEVVGSSYGLGPDARTAEFLIQALTAADAELDFRRFDNDGPDGVPNSGDDDGFVDAVAFEFVEVPASCGGPGIWPHRSRISNWGSPRYPPYATNDLRPDGAPVLVNDYIIQSAVSCPDGQEVQTAATIAHELGHVLGLPDLYHPVAGILPQQRRWVLGCWDLMAAGAWGCGEGGTFAHGQRPTHFSAWTKERLGWIQLDTVGAVREADFRLEPVELVPRALRVPIAGPEYFLVEYRTRWGFDLELPASGVLILHVDNSAAFRPAPTAPRIYRVSLEEADGDGALLKTAEEGGDRGRAGDAFTALRPRESFSNVTVPSARTNRDSLSTVTFHVMEVDGSGRARVLISTAPTPAVLGADSLPAAVALRPYEASVRAAGGALPYHWALAGGALPEGLAFVDSTATFSGTPLQYGAFTALVRVEDARGSSATASAALEVADVAIPLAVLLQPFLETPGTAPTELEQRYLDVNGNRNGRYDVGDLRARLLANPGLLRDIGSGSR